MNNWWLSCGPALVRTTAIFALAALPICLQTPVGAAELGTATTQSTKSTTGGSECSSELVIGKSGKGRLSAYGNATVSIPSSGSHARINGGTAQVTNYNCKGGDDNTIRTTKLKVRMKWEITATRITSCEVGVPSGFKCTISGNTKVITKEKICNRKTTCARDIPNEWFVYPRASARITKVIVQVKYYAKQSGKPSVDGLTEAAEWYPGS